MRFTKGNRALRDHVLDGKDVHVFEEVRKKSGWLRYKGQMVCTGSPWVNGPDTQGNPRKAILFELTPIETFQTHPVAEGDGEQDSSEVTTASPKDLRDLALADSAAARNAVERRAVYRQRSRAIRLYVLKRSAGMCEGCGTPAPFRTSKGQPYVEPHHIRRLTDGGPDHPDWVIAVCPNCHRRAHYSEDASDFNERLQGMVTRLEKAAGAGR